MAEIGSIIDGKYEILTEIGRGGMSVVYLAMDTHLNKQWAVKEIRKKSKGKMDEIIVNSLLAEANLMKRLDHPALPRIVDIIDNGVTIFVVMDYIEGETLDKVVKEFGAQPEDLVIEWAKQLCDALSYLHSQKPPIIYRDMKPANIMLKPEGNIKLFDFGIAREYKEQSLADTTVLGTKGYAPPEQYSGQTDIRSDIFALGMTMHHLLTGVDPRKGEAYAPVRAWNPELSEGIELIIDKCVQPAAENRYQNCADLLYDLDHPELITIGYKKKQKRKLRLFVAALTISVVLFTTGFICKKKSVKINNSNYDNLISASSATSIEEKIDSYERAIEIYPLKTDAYIKIIDAYEDEGNFSEGDSAKFIKLYNDNYLNMDKGSVGFAELNYKSGCLYFNYYTDNNGNVSFSDRVQRAYTFFDNNYTNDSISSNFEHKELSDCYYYICLFYKEYILKQTGKEAKLEDYDELFDTIENALSSMQNADDFDRVSLYNAIFMLLYDQRVGMAYVGFDEDRVLETFDYTYSETIKIYARKDKTTEMINQIKDKYEEYRSAIERAYSNAEER